MKYTVFYEPTPSGFSVYVPDLPGCVSAGETIDEARAGIEEAIAFHIEGMRKDGEPIPQPSVSEVVEVAV
jgi:predicted RNase H-like HicB family nuclease